MASFSALAILLTNKATNVSLSASRNYYLIKVRNYPYSFPIPTPYETKIKDFLTKNLGANAHFVYNVTNGKKSLLNLEDTITGDAS